MLDSLAPLEGSIDPGGSGCPGDTGICWNPLGSTGIQGSSPAADGVHAVDGGDAEGLVLGAGQAAAQRAQPQALVVPAAGALHHVRHGHLLRRPHGAAGGQRAPVQLLGHCEDTAGLGTPRGMHTVPQSRRGWSNV